MDDRADESAGILRRTFVTGAVASGFALAVQPITAATIITDTAGLDAGMITIRTDKGDIPGYRAHPAGKADVPTVLVIQEIFGLHEHIKDICRRLAKLGYYAIAPDLFFRLGDATKAAKEVCKARFEGFGSAGQASRIKPIALGRMSELYASGKLRPVVH